MVHVADVLVSLILSYNQLTRIVHQFLGSKSLQIFIYVFGDDFDFFLPFVWG